MAPKPDRRLGWLEASIETRNGVVRSRWEYRDSGVRYEIETGMPAIVVIDGTERSMPAGNYIFWGSEKEKNK